MNEWEQYSLTEEEWNALTEEEKEAYRKVGEVENAEQPEDAASGEPAETEVDV